ncbi:MAG: ECF transporter S component [Erysipelotrichaceae bacterium]
MKKNHIVVYALGIAMVFAVTACISIPTPYQGYINIGDSIVLLFASVLSPVGAFIVGGVGSALADLFLGYTHYALFSLIIKGTEGLIVSILFKKLKDKLKVSSYFIGIIIMIIGYMFAKTILYSSFALGLSSIPENLIQGLASCLIAIIAIKPFRKIANKNPKLID